MFRDKFVASISLISRSPRCAPRCAERPLFPEPDSAGPVPGSFLLGRGGARSCTPPRAGLRGSPHSQPHLLSHPHRLPLTPLARLLLDTVPFVGPKAQRTPRAVSPVPGPARRQMERFRPSPRVVAARPRRPPRCGNIATPASARPQARDRGASGASKPGNLRRRRTVLDGLLGA